MPSPFTSVTRVALEEMVLEHMKPSKYGYFMTKDDQKKLVEKLVEFLATSRSLKAAGDRLMQQQLSPPGAPRPSK